MHPASPSPHPSSPTHPHHPSTGKNSPLLLEPHKNGLFFKSEIRQNLCNGEVKRLDLYENCGKIGNGVWDKFEKNETLLKIAALEGANNSHAPYSGCPSGGVAFMDYEGKVYKGSYFESAAYNPSLGPVQAALVAYIAGGGGGYERIVATALVEKEGASVSQEDM